MRFYISRHQRQHRLNLWRGVNQLRRKPRLSAGVDNGIVGRWGCLPEFLANLRKIAEMVTPTGIEPVFQP